VHTRTRTDTRLGVRPGTWLMRLLALGLLVGGLQAVMLVHAAGQSLVAVTLLLLLASAAWAYTSAHAQALRFVFPGLAAALVFVVLPMAYTVGIGFTNASSSNLLTREQVRAYLLGERVPAEDSRQAYSLLAAGDGRVHVRLVGGLQSPPITLPPEAPAERIEVALQQQGGDAALPELPLAARVQALPGLRALVLVAPDGRRLELLGLREFAVLQPLYREQSDGALVDALGGATYRPDEASGFYSSASGERLQPGYRVNVGFAHYLRIATDARFREPFLRVFAWTVAFAALSVAGAAGLGLLLAVLLNWEALRGRALYRLVLFLPYAVPGFISILVFKGLFNQNLGELNLILDALFGVRPAWFSDPLLAKVMLLVVNVWLGFPYMMVLASGLIQSIPADLYEASAVEGAGPLANFRRITAPLILKPLTPLLISAFAFNFNNFVLVSLLTGGRPDQLDAVTPAGTTDLLVSYTWRIAFQDSGQQFGLAAAISTLIFLVVAAITLLQMRLTRANAQTGRG
jgi:maltose/maltodextrin transport system permease protein